MDINSLTIGEAKMIASIFQNTDTNNNSHPYEIDKNYIVRTVTMIYTGKLVSVFPSELVLVDASWIPDTGRFMDFVAEGKVNECEPYPDGHKVIIGRGSIVDACVLTKSLPRLQK